MGLAAHVCVWRGRSDNSVRGAGDGDGDGCRLNGGRGENSGENGKGAMDQYAGDEYHEVGSSSTLVGEKMGATWCPLERWMQSSVIVEGERYEPRRKTYIYVNNRLEGNALETIAALLERLALHDW
jgi:hypothetical protein